MSSIEFIEPICLLRKARNVTVILAIAITEPFIAPFFTMMNRLRTREKLRKKETGEKLDCSWKCNKRTNGIGSMETGLRM